MKKKGQGIPKGERIYKTLLDPDRNDIAATEWLILYIIKNNKKPTSEFIDDTLINIETAQNLGFKTHHLKSTERIELIKI